MVLQITPPPPQKMESHMDKTMDNEMDCRPVASISSSFQEILNEIRKPWKKDSVLRV